MSTVVLKEFTQVSLKKSGYIKQRQKDMFTVRLRVPCGNMSSEQIIGIGHIAKQFGGGYVHITTRQGLQIPNVNVNDLDKTLNALLTFLRTGSNQKAASSHFSRQYCRISGL